MKKIDLGRFEALCEARHVFPHGIVIRRDGETLADKRYAEDAPHELNSVTKCVTSLAAGIAQAEGCLSLDDRVGSFFPEYDDMDPLAASAKVRHFLMMAAGRSAFLPDAHMPNADVDDWVRDYLRQKRDREPGTFFVYESAATNTVSAILQKATGRPLPDYVQEKLFDPMQIPRPRWDRMSNGVPMGGAGLHLRTGDLAKIGDLLLAGGRYGGVQLVPETYVRTASSNLIRTDNLPRIKDNSCGYGLALWQNSTEGYRADGYNGQFVIVLERLRAVITMTSYTPGYMDVKQQLALDTIWDSLYVQLQETL